MKRTNVFVIGNSFSGNALTYFGELTRSAPMDIMVKHAMIGGCSLEKHWNISCLSEKDASVRPYGTGHYINDKEVRFNLPETLASVPWDIITLQQVSWRSWQAETFEPGLGNLVALIKKLAPTAEIVMHQTWPYRSDSPHYKEWGIGDDQMYNGIRDAYASYAKAYGFRVIPSGTAFYRVMKMKGRTFTAPDPSFDYEHPVYPALPKQEHTLHVGWHWREINTDNGLPVVGYDHGHANDRGCYLAGCVWYEFFTGLDARKLTFVPGSIAADDAAMLREAAHDAVAEHRK
ncbi:MAG: DUF4886 domain-containing protein [Spirochaetes bacterium]|nr:DUF4886 domain-containing protein [Spirochaetota bacterium]